MTTTEEQNESIDSTDQTTNGNQEKTSAQPEDPDGPNDQRGEDASTADGAGADPGWDGIPGLRFDQVVTLLVIGGIVLVMRMSPVTVGPFTKVVTASLFVVILLAAYSRQTGLVGEADGSLSPLIDELTDIVAVLAVVGVAIGIESVPNLVYYAIASIALGKRAFGQ